jgi:hypothetical protein
MMTAAPESARPTADDPPATDAVPVVATAGEDALLSAVLGVSEHPLHVRLRLIQSGMAEVQDIDGVPTLVVDPIFERVRAAVLDGLDDEARSRGPKVEPGPA